MEDFELDFANSESEKCFDWVRCIEIKGQFDVRGENVNVYPNEIVIDYGWDYSDEYCDFTSTLRKALYQGLGHDAKAEFTALCDLMDSIYSFHDYMEEEHADCVDIAEDESWALRQDHFNRY